MEPSIFQLPSPVEEVPYTPINQNGISLYIKRDDLIHAEISGNKWRKLRYNIEKAQLKGHDTLLTFGGAFSNHIAATAAAGRAFGMKTIGMVRGEDADLDNPTLSFARTCGMRIHPISRERFRQADQWEFRSSLKQELGSFYFIPQGGANELGVLGCMDILGECKEHYDRIFVACGTGTTAAGIAISAKGKCHVHAISVLKNGGFLKEEIRQWMDLLIHDPEVEDHLMGHLHLETAHHFGGYARTAQALIDFMRDFHRQTHIKLDPVYTGKAAFAMCELARENPSFEGEKWLLIHTGGLQGIPPMERKLGLVLYPDC